MNQRLTIGVDAVEPGLFLLLEQLGVAFEEIGDWGVVSAADYAVIIITRAVDAGREAAVARYLAGGGSVLETGAWLHRLRGAPIKRRWVDSIAPAPQDDLFGDVWLVDIERAVRHYADADHLRGLVACREFGGGAIASVPFSPAALFTDSGRRRKRFDAGTEIAPDEIVARVAKGELRRVFERALQWLHEARGLPLLHRWRFPGEAESLFAYRIDSDYGTREQIEALHAAAERCAMPMTWFLHVAAHRPWLALFTTFERDEIGLHCVRHRTFETYEENAANIAEGLRLMEEMPLHPKGFAAPNGFWNRNLARAVADAGFDYASEFSLDYDNFPLVPNLPGPVESGASGPVLQIPIHPVCIGSLRRAKVPADAMQRYFRRTIDRMLHLREPAILYHHPGHEEWDVMEDSMRHARDRGAHPTTMGAYARWWRRRGLVRFEATLAGDAIVVRRDDAHEDVRIAMTTSDGRLAFIANDGACLADVHWRPAPEPAVERPAEIGRLRRFSLRTLRHTIEDFNARARQ